MYRYMECYGKYEFRKILYKEVNEIGDEGLERIIKAECKNPNKNAYL